MNPSYDLDKIRFATDKPNCVKAFKELKGKETCFGWEEPLLKMVDKN